MALTPEEDRLSRLAHDARKADLEFLEELVRINSGSANLAGVESVGDRVRPKLDALGFHCTWHAPSKGHKRERPARSLVARRKAAGKPIVFLTAHLDTVFEPEDGFEGFVYDGERAVGPGIVDCKGGVVLLLRALDAIREAGLADRAEWRVVLGGDEETGSYESRSIVENEAAGAAFSLVFEGGRPSGDIVSYRAGNGGFDVRAIGKAAHAGNAHKEGINAAEALAHAVLKIQSLTDYARGVTLNVGTMRGGTKRNIVPGEAHAEVDVRYASAADAQWLDESVRAIAGDSAPKGSHIEIAGGLNRPPWPVGDAKIDDLAKRWIAAAADCGITMKAGPTGGGSDGNWTAAMGIPTLDGLGPVGGKYHTIGEYLLVDTLPQRAALCAVALSRLLHT